MDNTGKNGSLGDRPTEWYWWACWVLLPLAKHHATHRDLYTCHQGLSTPWQGRGSCQTHSLLVLFARGYSQRHGRGVVPVRAEEQRTMATKFALNAMAGAWFLSGWLGRGCALGFLGLSTPWQGRGSCQLCGYAGGQQHRPSQRHGRGVVPVRPPRSSRGEWSCTSQRHGRGVVPVRERTLARTALTAFSQRHGGGVVPVSLVRREIAQKSVCSQRHGRGVVPVRSRHSGRHHQTQPLNAMAGAWFLSAGTTRKAPCRALSLNAMAGNIIESI